MKCNKSVALMACCIFAIFSCGKEKNTIDIFVYKYDTFITEMSNALKKYFEDYSYNFYDANESQINQNDQILDSLSNGSRLLIINTVDRLASSAIIEKCESQKKPIIFFNREPLQDDLNNKENMFYVGASAEIAGEYQAEMAADLFGSPYKLNSHYDKNGDNKIQLVVIKGEKGHQDAEIRTKRSTDKLRELGYQIDILTTETANWDRKEGKTVMKSMYEEYGDSIELVLSNNDDMALGAIDYLLDVGIFNSNVDNSEQPFPIFGVDATGVGVDGLRKGYLSGTVLNDADGQAKAVKTLADYIIEGKSFQDFPYSFTNGNYIYIDEKKMTISDL